MFSYPLPSNEDEWQQFSANIKEEFNRKMEDEKLRREAEERNAKRRKAYEQFSNRRRWIHSFIESDATQFECLPMTNYERHKIHEQCQKRGLCTKSEGEGELRRVIVYKSNHP